MSRRCRVCHTEYGGTERFCSLDGGPIVVDDAVTTDPLIGRTIDGRYFVRALLGRGGMGVVYEADHVGLDKRVAIKFVLHADADGDTRARFRNEARAAGKVVHPHVVQVTDVGADADADYIVMELVRGRDLQAVLAGVPMPPGRVIAIIRQVLAGLAAIHDAGIVHRDIKPANVLLLDSDGDGDTIKITDFGIAKSMHGAPLDTGTGRIIGTPQFMAPEQLMDRPLDHRADLYSVGIMMFVMLTGSLPFRATSVTDLAAIIDEPAPELAGHGLSPALSAAVATALQKEPHARFADARAFAAALADLPADPGGPGATDLAGATVRTSDPAARDNDARTVSERPRGKVAGPTRPRSWGLSAVLVGAMVAVVGFLLVWRLGARPSKPVTVAPVIAVVPADAPPADASPLDASVVDARSTIAELVAAGEVAATAGESAKAIAAYEDAVAVGGPIDLELRIAELYDRLGAVREARAHYETFVAGGPPGPDRDRAKARLTALAPTRPTASTRRPVVPAVPGPGQRRCECLGYVGEVQHRICQTRRKVPSCECMTSLDYSRELLCSVPDRELENQRRECKTDFVYRGAPDASCRGFLRGQEMGGTIRCTFCAAKDGGRYGYIFFGNKGDECQGYSLHTGVPVNGTMTRCMTDDAWNQRPVN